jgi:putative oxidoreductase
MPRTTQGILAVLGRLMLATIFLLSAVGKLGNFNGTAGMMADKGIPAARILLVGAIAFEVAGGLSIVLGYRPRIGAVLLLVFLVLATYYFHDFWRIDDPKERQDQMVHFLKNLAIMGAMVLIIANGTGPMSLDDRVIGTGERPTGPQV